MTCIILTCSPYFHEPALHELRRHHPDLRLHQELAPGYLLLEADTRFDDLTAPWRHRLPIYLHHLFPVHQQIPVDDFQREWPTLADSIQALAPADSLIQVRTLPDTPAHWSHLVQAMFPQPAKPRGRITSVVISQDRLYMGISWAPQNCSAWAGGVVPIHEPVSNRAGYKLLEATQVLGLRLHADDHALDLGAAPGAWTTILRQRGLRVTAVSPDALYPWLTRDAGVRHEPVLAEDYLPRCRERFDLIVNDMRVDARDSARLMVAYADHLPADGVGLMTLKLHDHQRPRIMDHTYRLLRPAYKIMQIRQLVHNRREVTLLLRRK
jgi:23S rRNA (cytidine2498-2'-O)-methyltransferase